MDFVTHLVQYLNISDEVCLLASIPEQYITHQWIKREHLPSRYGKQYPRTDEIVVTLPWNIDLSALHNVQKQYILETLRAFDCIIAGGFATRNAPEPKHMLYKQAKDKGDIDIFVRPGAMDAIVSMSQTYYQSHDIHPAHTPFIKRGVTFTEIFFPRATGLLNIQIIAKGPSTGSMSHHVLEKFDLSHCRALVQYNHLEHTLNWRCTLSYLYTVHTRTTTVTRVTSDQRVNKAAGRGWIVHHPDHSSADFLDKEHSEIEHQFLQFLTDTQCEFHGAKLYSIYSRGSVPDESDIYLAEMSSWSPQNGHIIAADNQLGTGTLTLRFKDGLTRHDFRITASYCLVRSIELDQNKDLYYCVSTRLILGSQLIGGEMHGTYQRDFNTSSDYYITDPPLFSVPSIAYFARAAIYRFKVKYVHFTLT